MELTDSFVVPVSADRLWDVLTDVERIAPCVPGFTLSEVDGSDFRGRMKVKVGAITVQYEVGIAFVERDAAARRAVISISGGENRGAGSVDARVTATLSERGDETVAEMLTDVRVTGRVAQFGRGIMADVSSRVVEQFVACLNQRVLGTAPTTPLSVPLPAQPQEAPLDLGAVAVLPVLKRIAPFVLGVAVGRISKWRRRSHQ
jgi:carbon monoxide dehydrogenase subunit G